MNNVREKGASNIKVERLDKGLLIKIDYEVRIPLLYNIDVVLNFSNHLDTTRPHLCCDPLDDK